MKANWYKEVEMAKDPICGMDVDEKNAPATSNYKGKTYYFCVKACKERFDKSPEKFIKEEKK
ncbi:MAG: YHS domain-containing protein [Nitrospirota bacterium]